MSSPGAQGFLSFVRQIRFRLGQVSLGDHRACRKNFFRANVKVPTKPTEELQHQGGITTVSLLDSGSSCPGFDSHSIHKKISEEKYLMLPRFINGATLKEVDSGLEMLIKPIKYQLITIQYYKKCLAPSHSDSFGKSDQDHSSRLRCRRYNLGRGGSNLFDLQGEKTRRI